MFVMAKKFKEGDYVRYVGRSEEQKYGDVYRFLYYVVDSSIIVFEINLCNGLKGIRHGSENNFDLAFSIDVGGG